MKRIILSLNEMSFELPKGWSLTKDKYNLSNGQGFLNKENYLSESGKVISFFEVHRDPDEFFDSYQKLLDDYSHVTDSFTLEKQFSFKFNDFEFPAYVIKGVNDTIIRTLQVFVNCGDCLGCFMVMVEHYSNDLRDMIRDDEGVKAVAKILRTIE